MWFNSYGYVSDGYSGSQYSKDIQLIRRGILLDTAPLFILVMGHYDNKHETNFIKNFNSKDKGKNRTYEKFDYDYLLAFLNSLGLGRKYQLLITPHIFTELIKHVWECVDDPNRFEEILCLFKNKNYFEETHIGFVNILGHMDFLKKKIEIGDVSITMLKDIHKKKPLAILTDDGSYANMANQKYDMLVISYNEIRNSTISLGNKKIPKEFLKEPICTYS